MVKPGFHTQLHFQEFPDPGLPGRRQPELRLHRPEHAHAADRDPDRQQLRQAHARHVRRRYVRHAQGRRPARRVRRLHRRAQRQADRRRHQGRQGEADAGAHRPRLRPGSRDRQRAPGRRHGREHLHRRGSRRREGQDEDPISRQAEKQNQPPPATKSQPPGGSTQYSDPGITDQDMQGQSAKPQQKGAAGKKASGKGDSKP